MAEFADIIGWGKCLPPAVLSNDDIAGVMDTSDDWIFARSGIRERRISHLPVSDLAAVAGLRAVAAGGRAVNDIDLIVVATSSPDTIIPCTAAHVQKKMGIKNAASMDLVAGCSGFIYGLVVVSSMIRAGAANTALLIGAERISWYLNWSQRDTAVLFGDGAGALVLQASDHETGLLGSELGC